MNETHRPSDRRIAPRLRKLARAVIMILTSLVAILLVAALAEFMSFRDKAIEREKAELVKLTVDAVSDIDAIAIKTIAITSGLAAEITADSISKDQIEPHLKQIVIENKDIYGITVAYAPYAYSPTKKHHAAYYFRTSESGPLSFSNFENAYDYFTAQWFTRPMERGPSWTDPYFDSGAGAIFMITYAEPFYETDSTGKRTPIGTVSIDLSMNQLRDVLESLDLGPSGYPALTTRDGRYLYHPTSDYVTKGMTLVDVAREKNDQTRLKMSEKVAHGESGIMEHRSTTTGKESWMIFETSGVTGWSLQNTFIKEGIVIDSDGNRRRLIVIIILAVLAATGTLALGMHIENRSVVRLWTLAAITSVVLLAGIGTIWAVALQYSQDVSALSRSVVSRSEVKSVAHEYEEICDKNHLERPLFIPTGIDLQSIRFETPNDIHISGYVWQKYTRGVHDFLNRGVVFSGASEVKAEEVWRQTIGNTELVRWRFETLIRDDMNYSHYPIDQANIQIRLVHRDLNHNVVLLPDLNSYKFNTPELRPGIDNEAFIPGWRLDRSFFSLEKRVKNSTYGEVESIAKENFPVLTFNVGITRYFINAFISNLIPIIIVMTLLFMLLCIADKIDTGRFMSICVGMFLVVIFSHVDVRNAISAQAVFYLEYFYFITYSFILLVCVSAITISMKEKFRFVAWRGNLAPKLLFWPVVMLTLFVITAKSFW